MDISHVGTQEILDDHKLIGRRINRSVDRLGSGLKVTSPKQDPLLWGDLQGLKNAVGRMQAFSENLNRGAGSVRTAIGSIEVSDSHLIQLGLVLESALLAPEGSKIRAKGIKRYNELHDMLNDLAAPQDLGARKLLDDPVRFPAAGPLEVAAGDNGYTITLQNRQIHTGAEGLDLPKAGEPLPSDPMGSPAIVDIENATNDEIRLMMDYISVARDKLEVKAKALAVDAAAIESSDDFNQAFIERNEDAVSTLNVPDLEAEAVLAQALDLRNALAISGLTGFEESKRMVLTLLQ